MVELSYLVGFPPEERLNAVTLYDAAFGAKLGVAIPDAKRRLALFTDGITPERSIAAMQKGRVVGLAGFYADDTSFTSGITTKLLRKHLGLFGMLRAAVILSLYERKPHAGELLMDGIAVDPAMRGQGIGTGLLRALFNYASEHGYQSVRLDVIDTNPGARRLYEREGFVAAQTNSYPLLKGLLGFSASTTMIKAIGEAVYRLTE